MSDARKMLLIGFVFVILPILGGMLILDWLEGGELWEPSISIGRELGGDKVFSNSAGHLDPKAVDRIIQEARRRGFFIEESTVYEFINSKRGGAIAERAFQEARRERQRLKKGK